MNRPKAPVIKIGLSALLVLNFAACTTESQQKVNTFLSSPMGVTLKNTLTKAVEAAAAELIREGGTGDKLHGNQIMAAALEGGSNGLRTTQDTSAVTDPKAIKAAVATGSDSPTVASTVAPAVANAITNATAKDKNVAPNTVSEAAAQVLEDLAARKRQQGQSATR